MEYNPPDDFPARVRTMQIIVIALVMGLVLFLAIACFVAPTIRRGMPFGGLPLLTLIGLGLAAIELVARTIIVRTMVLAARRKLIRGEPVDSRAGVSSHAEELVSLYQICMIVSAACLEGAAFFLLIAYILEHSPWALTAAVAMVLGVAAHFPTQQRVSDFVERQTSLLEEQCP